MGLAGDRITIGRSQRASEETSEWRERGEKRREANIKEANNDKEPSAIVEGRGNNQYQTNGTERGCANGDTQQRVEWGGTIVRSASKQQKQQQASKKTNVYQVESIFGDGEQQATEVDKAEETDEHEAPEMAPNQVVHSQPTGNKPQLASSLQQIISVSQQPQRKRVHNHNNHQHHQHYQRHHTPACLASRLVSARSTKRQHQPHCPHHSRAGQREQLAVTAAEAEVSDLDELAGEPSADIRQAKYNLKPQKDSNSRPYVLAEYHRPPTQQQQQQQYKRMTTAAGFGSSALGEINRSHYHQNADITSDVRSPAAGSSESMRRKNKWTTMKFISQLYFLIHLSLVVALLLHHKNLVNRSADRRLSSQQQSPPTADDQMQTTTTTTTTNGTHQVKKKATVGGELSTSSNQIQKHQLTDYDLLPIPSTLDAELLALGGNQLVSSVIASPARNPETNGYSSGSSTNSSSSSEAFRHVRRVNRMLAPTTDSPDILVGLMGYSHASNALQYLLFYLLASSVTILVSLCLLKSCALKRSRTRNCDRCHLRSSSSANQSSTHVSSVVIDEAQNQSPLNYQQLDCTPVLVGSISLGLVQLIVIGLDIANNIDWLGNARWSLHLPLLQFAFVALLIQLILGRVAKNREQKNKSGTLTGSLVGAGKSSDSRQADLSINALGRANYRLCSCKLTSGSDSTTTATRAAAAAAAVQPIGLENIALAHLLVTHILLWLMRLNSISLFQAFEQQQLLPAGVGVDVVQRPSNRFVSSNRSNSFETQSSGSFGVGASPSLPQKSDDGNNNSNGGDDEDDDKRRSRNNGPELESILRRKPPLAPVVPPAEPKWPARNGEEADKVLSTLELPAVVVASGSGGNRVTAANQSTSQTGRNGALDNKRFPAQANGSFADNLSVKNERGLRSTERDDLKVAKESAELGLPSRPKRPPPPPPPVQVQVQTRSPKPPLEAANSSTTVILSQAELANLLSLAEANKAGGQQQRRSNSTVGVFKSSLPKRMTAFRQTKPSTGAKTIAQSYIPHNIINVHRHHPRQPVTHILEPNIAASEQQQHQGNNFGAQNQQQQQRSRHMLVAASPGQSNGASLVEPIERLSGRGGRQGRVNTPVDLQPVSTFPSVDSDPPKGWHTPSSSGGAARIAHGGSKLPATMPAKASVEATLTERRQQQKTVERKEEAANSEAAPKMVTEIIEDLEGETDDTEEADIDLDSLLPPIPNYNDTTTATETDQAKGAASSEVFEANDLPNDEHDEGALMFNEAASTIEFTTTTTTTANTTRDSATLTPSKAPLHGLNYQGQQQQHGQRWSSFADYLLPIVHQYHILIVAILLNIWLDCLHTLSPSAKAIHRHQQQQPQKSWPFSGRMFISHRELLAPPTSGSSSQSTQTADQAGGSRESNKLAESAHLESTPPKHLLASQANSMAPAQVACMRPLAHKRSLSADSAHLMRPTEESCGSAVGSSSSSQLSVSGQPHDHHDHLHHHHRHRHSMRSSSSERLLWIPSSAQQRGGHSFGVPRHAYSPVGSLSSLSLGCARSQPWASAGRTHGNSRQVAPASVTIVSVDDDNLSVGRSSSPAVCILLSGLLVVSASLIVMLLGVELLSIATQCLAQFISILVCLLGLCLTWFSERRWTSKEAGTKSVLAMRTRFISNKKEQHRPLATSSRYLYFRRLSSHHNALATQPPFAANESTTQISGSGRQCFNYLFLLAAYYCGLATALNLGKQRSVHQVFSQQVVQFLQRHLSGLQLLNQNQRAGHHQSALQQPEPLANYLLLFHALLALKGLLLAAQVTLQTALIRLGPLQKRRRNLRRLYSFLMFANLSLWAMDICEQQQLLRGAFGFVSGGAEFVEHVAPAPDSSLNLVTLDGFTKFASSIVTLSHLYHGLVFMQQH